MFSTFYSPSTSVLLTVPINVPMTLSPTAPSSAQAHLGGTPSLNKDALPQSREMGDVIPNRTPPVSEEQPEAKPFAHFVAGGYVTNTNTTAEADHQEQ